MPEGDLRVSSDQGGSNRRPRLAIYLTAIVAPSLVLLYLSWQSIHAQRAAIETQRERIARLSAEQLVSRLEDRVAAQASGCLTDARFQQMARLAVAGDTVNIRQALTRLASSIKADCPLAEELFLAGASGLRYPFVRGPLPRSLDAGPADPPAVAAFVRTYEEAEHLYASGADAAHVAGRYQRCASLPVPDELRVLALRRVAQASVRLGRRDVAVEKWLALATHHRDRYDLLNKPFGLTAALELGRILGGTACSATRTTVLR